MVCVKLGGRDHDSNIRVKLVFTGRRGGHDSMEFINNTGGQFLDLGQLMSGLDLVNNRLNAVIGESR